MLDVMVSDWCCTHGTESSCLSYSLRLSGFCVPEWHFEAAKQSRFLHAKHLCFLQINVWLLSRQFAFSIWACVMMHNSRSLWTGWSGLVNTFIEPDLSVCTDVRFCYACILFSACERVWVCFGGFVTWWTQTKINLHVDTCPSEFTFSLSRSALPLCTFCIYRQYGPMQKLLRIYSVFLTALNMHRI